MNTKKAMECRNHNVLSSFKQIHDVPFADLINWVYARGYGSINSQMQEKCIFPAKNWTAEHPTKQGFNSYNR